jgi:hypothetical protein
LNRTHTPSWKGKTSATAVPESCSRVIFSALR